ncbi:MULTISPECIES: DUF6000 family protein [unclassified Microcoleus]|uniref:DUF6000 family protein n=1 Tax=unclassified Microcoleus TaxID=2642155 RepID=UPI002FD11CCA
MTEYNIPKHYVQPLYLNVLHGNFLRRIDKEDVDAFVDSTRVALYEVTDKQLIHMYNRCWRHTITASWLCGIGRFPQHLNKIETLLSPSQTCYAGQFHCFALARFDGAESVRVLRSYLDTYLPVGDRQYDQEWAIGALRWLDRRHGTDYAQVYLKNSDNWKLRYLDHEYGTLRPEEGILHFQKVMDFVDKYFPEFAA